MGSAKVIPLSTAQANSLTGAIVIANRTNVFAVSVTIDGTVHSARIARNAEDTAWKVSCTCGESFGIVDRATLGRDRQQAWRDAAAEAWNHISGCVYYAITGD